MKKFSPYSYIDEMRSNTYLFDIDHLDIHDFNKLEQFRQNWDVDASLVDIAGMWTEFMAFKLDCMSCSVTAAYFEEFYEWIVKKEKENE